MLTIGLTGGIGTGKSVVADLLKQHGAAIIDADRLGHEAYTPHTEAWEAVVAAFGNDILTPEGEIDRRKLGGIVFADVSQLERLNGIMHPIMARMVEQRKSGLQDDGVAVAVVEAAVLFEAGWDALVDEVWTTDAPVDTVVQRLRERNGLSDEEARKRINSQMPAAERNRRSDVVVNNAADPATLRRTVAAMWETRVKGKVNQSNG
jgi:dephospho-CoA kinase